MKKFLLTVLMLASVLFVGCNKNGDTGSVSFPDSSQSSSSTGGSDVAETPEEEDGLIKRKITYIWNEYGTVYEGIEKFPEEMVKGINIPKEYAEGKTLALPTLKTWNKNSKILYDFMGWYYDEALTEKVTDNTLSATQKGDVTLYAKCVAYIR